ncbi:MAG: hypothetical protein CL679_12340 [Bermanella sp.]|nr:hypothetical protein [Bermanella sp.]|tara:strand:+ start:90 stop:812 length:723 start_codon:yes stop_codon:yes gene_type:complete
MTARLLIILTFLSSAFTWAETEAPVKEARWYQVNLTLFQQKPDTRLDESFTFTALPLDMADIVELKTNKPFTLANSGMNATLAFHHENANNRAFTEQTIDDDWAETMSKLDPVNQPILYNAQWQQPVYDQKHSLPIYIESSLQELGSAKLKGLFYLHVSRYLHSKIDLQFIPNNANSASDLISFQESRRMRSKEVHYIDHPLVGAIVRILPVEHPLEIKEDSAPLNDGQPAVDSALNVRL